MILISAAKKSGEPSAGWQTPAETTREHDISHKESVETFYSLPLQYES